MLTSPLYKAVADIDWHWRTKYRWLIAWWYFRISGTACWIASGNEGKFWERMLHVARYSITAVPLKLDCLSLEVAVQESQYTYGDKPEDMVQVFLNAGPSYGRLISTALSHEGFNRETAFVIGCSLQGVLHHKINFPDRLAHSYTILTLEKTQAILNPWIKETPLAKELWDELKKQKGVEF